MANEFIARNGLIAQNNSVISGSLNVISGITGSFTGSFTGTTTGTASWATNALTASYVVTAQTASYVQNAQTASYVLQAVSSSFASTTSLAPNYVLNSATSSFVTNSQTSSFVTNSQTSSFVINSQTGSFVTNSQTSSFVTTGSNTFNGNQIITGSLIISSSGANISNIIGGSVAGSRLSFKATNITGVPTSVSNMFSFFSNNTTELLRIGDSLNGQVDTAIWGAGNNGSGNYAMRFGSTYCYINGSSDARIMINGSGIIQCSSTTATMVQGITISDGKNITFNATTGTKIGSATTEKLAFWNKTPIVQPTTAIAAAAFVANTSGIANDTATFGGYTLGQVVQALRNVGILA